MSTAGIGPSETRDADFTKSWRYRIGIVLFVIGNGGIIVGLLLPLLGMAPGGKAGLVGVFILGGEIISLTSIVFLGKEGFKAIKSKVFSFVKTGYTESVGRPRHIVGIVLLLTHVFMAYTMAFFAFTIFRSTSAADPLPIIWNLDFDGQGSLYLTFFLIAEISFLVSLYVLGADWWGRFRQIFIWKGTDG